MDNQLVITVSQIFVQSSFSNMLLLEYFNIFGFGLLVREKKDIYGLWKVAMGVFSFFFLLFEISQTKQRVDLLRKTISRLIDNEKIIHSFRVVSRQSAYQSILGQETEPQISPEGCICDWLPLLMSRWDLRA